MTAPKPRAKKGTGSTFERPSGWYAQWTSRDPATGARRTHKKGAFKSEREARRFLTAQIAKVDRGTFVPAPKPKMMIDVLDDWLKAKTEIRPTTLDSYRVAVEKWLKPRIGGTKLQALTEQQVRALAAELGATGGKNGGKLSPRSVQLALATLKQAINYAVDQGWAAPNPATKVRVKVTRTRMSSWTPEQARQFLAASHDDRYVALYTLAITRGLRRGELAGLKWSNVDLDAGHITIVETVVLVHGRAQMSEPKTEAGRRRIGIDPAVIDVLRAHRRRQLADRLRAGTAWTDTNYVFTDEIGQGVKPDHVSGRFTKLCMDAKVPVIRMHDTRHTAASLMLANGVATKVVSEMLGHADTRITMDVYQHVLPGMSDAAGAMLSGLVL